MPNNDLQILKVKTARDLESFIRFPFKIYSKDPDWVPPLLSEQRAFLSPDKNPFFEHADVALWLARRGDEVVGTISSHIDHLHNEVHEERTGMFGFFETVEDYSVAEALLATARDWVRERGMSALRGPLSFSQNHVVGLLIDSVGGPPMVMMPYNYPYYADYIQRFGLSKAKDMYAYLGNMIQFKGDPSNLPTKLVRVTEKLKQRAGITVRSADMRDFPTELQRAKIVYNKAWEKNWGFVRMTDHEIDKMAADLKQIIDPNLAIVAEIEGEPVGIAISVPDVNQVFKHLNGRLFPIGWLKALWYFRKVNQARLMIMGVVEEYRGRGIEALLIFETLKAAVLNGYAYVEFSWILEDNDMMNRIVTNLGEDYGTGITRTYRVFQMDF